MQLGGGRIICGARRPCVCVCGGAHHLWSTQTLCVGGRGGRIICGARRLCVWGGRESHTRGGGCHARTRNTYAIHAIPTPYQRWRPCAYLPDCRLHLQADGVSITPPLQSGDGMWLGVCMWLCSMLNPYRDASMRRTHSGACVPA
eukprot:356224-Chlamydomonas_euryale.AAC.1